MENGIQEKGDSPGQQFVIERDDMEQLLEVLGRQGYEVLGPTCVDAAVVYEPIKSIQDLPIGMVDEQDGGRYRLVRGAADTLFAYVHGPHTWKHHLYPPRQRLFQASSDGMEFTVTEEPREAGPRALLGVRACELNAMAIQDRVFDNGDFSDPGYLERRQQALVIAVNCTRAGGTCFCASMNSGPKVAGHFDLALTELLDDDGHRFLVEVGSGTGAGIIDAVKHRAASAADLDAAAAGIAAATASMGREMVPDVAALLQRNLEHPRWEEVAARCLSCANCTMVCPTCFCSSVTDSTDLQGGTAERWREWDSCFTMDFSYIHGGSIRRTGRSRYRQWMTHKLSTWHEQFGTSGCVGCGRCITWCPVGIDITEEARAIQASEENQ